MDGKRKNGAVLSILLSLIFLSNSVSFSTGLEYQTFVVPSLPTPHTFSSWPTQLDSEIETQTKTETGNTLSLDLHHVDSFSPPPDSTTKSLFERRLNRDRLRVEALSARAAAAKPGFNASVFSGYMYGVGEYLTRFGIGTPPKNFSMILDTGTDVTWLQCLPCKSCYKQSDPIFNPQNSTSYSRVNCNDPRCKQLGEFGCGKHNKTCGYQFYYGDGSTTKGVLSSETLTFNKTTVNNVTLGCGRYNVGMFTFAAGLLGLSRGNLSFLNQIGKKFERKFSYCMPTNETNPSSIQFGNSAVPQNANFTPMLINPNDEVGFYSLGLNGISVNGSRLRNITRSTFSAGLIIDSGTSFTRLAEPAYGAMRDAFRNASRKLGNIFRHGVFDTCFNVTNLDPNATVPTVTLHFDPGANILLSDANTLTQADVGIFCLAFANSSDLSIIGNIQQKGFRVSYDLENKKVGFTADSCTS